MLSARFSRRAARKPLGALYALLDEIQTVLVATPTAEIRQAKIGFWETELAAARTGDARHPLARALPGGSVLAIAGAALEAARTEAALARAFPGDLLRTLLARELGHPLGLAAALEGGGGPEAAAYAEQVGTAYALTVRLQTLGFAYRYRPWEIASLAAARSDPGGDADEARVAMEVLREWAAAAYEAARVQATTAPRVPRFARVLAALGEELLAELSREIGADPRRLLAGRILLPGPRMRWIALRALWGRRWRLGR